VTAQNMVKVKSKKGDLRSGSLVCGRKPLWLVGSWNGTGTGTILELLFIQHGVINMCYTAYSIQYSIPTARAYNGNAT
jgi:hypothetical protein